MASMRQFGVLLLLVPSQGLLLVHRPEVDINESAFVLPIAGDCKCDIRQLECLPEPDCMAVALENEGARVAEGMAVRESMRKSMDWQERDEDQYVGATPVGKGAQYGNILAWKGWMTSGAMNSGFGEAEYPFIDPKRYPFCQEHHLEGRACAFQQFANEENKGEVESRASAGGDHQAAVTEFSKYKGNSQIMEQAQVSPNFYLMSFAHISRLRFNLQPSIEAAYRQKVVELNPGVGKLSVSLHIRRADSCGNVRQGQGFAMSKSTLDSHAQTTNVRQCYATGVYMDELRRVQRMYGKPLTVFLSTDGGNALMEEIKTNHTDVYQQFTWRYLDYTADTFEYNIVEESARDAQQSAVVGESSISDLWHLSHGEVFVGHLGSRFGKMGYVLAVARHNTLVPYVSVDGHNLCCEIDESCADATSKMHGMIDCLGYAHELSGGVNPDYWESGVTSRTSMGDR